MQHFVPSTLFPAIKAMEGGRGIMGRKVLETQEGSPSPSRWINRCACVLGFGVGSKQVTNKDPDADPGVMYQATLISKETTGRKDKDPLRNTIPRNHFT